MRSFGSSACTLRASGGCAVTAHSTGPADSLAIIHSTTPDAAQAIADELAGMLPGGLTPYIARVEPALGVQVGPGAIGVAPLQSRSRSLKILAKTLQFCPIFA